MRAFVRRLFAAVAILLLAGVAPAFAAGERTVILISIDGFRADYLDRGVTPNLSALAERGVRAAMHPSFPSLTFPNHYTLVTGLRPGHHGIVSNSMSDPEIGKDFSLGARDMVMDRRWWDDAEPLWVTARKQGLMTATMFWPGSEAAIHGVRPNYWVPFQQDVSSKARVDILLGWLSLPPEERPRFLTLYFDVVDTAGHHHGPGSAETNEALADVDKAIGRLVEGLERRGLTNSVDIVVVADHGMAESPDTQVIVVDDIIDLTKARFLGGEGTVGVYPAAGAEAEIAAALTRPLPHMTCWRKADVPARYAYVHRRAPPIVCLAEEGWTMTTRERLERSRSRNKGYHGFEPDLPSMAAVFVAAGPDFREGVRLPTFDNVSVYPLLARLLDVTPVKNDGRLSDTAAALR